MRIWSIHPKYLDTKGLTALWRETLLAKNVLEGKTKGYKKHPQLDRFKASEHPLDAINFYLEHTWLESKRRHYNYDRSKFYSVDKLTQIAVTQGQVNFEIKHLLSKLKVRDIKLHDEIAQLVDIDIHPLFKLTKGDIEPWEKL